MKKVTVFLGICTFIIPFILYNLTLAPTILWNDSGEFITAAYTLGIAHPSGYPTYILLGKLFSLLPFGSVALRLNFMSAFLCSLTVTILFIILVKLTKNHTISFLSALIFAFSYTFWDQATFAEVHPLHVFLFSLMILIFVAWNDNAHSSLIYIFAFLLGLSLTNHLLTLLMVPAAIYFILVKDHKKWFEIKLNKEMFKFKKIILIILFFVIGLTPYLYLPLRSAQHPAINWGDTEHMLNFIRHVTGREYAYKILKFPIILEQIPLQAANLFIKQFIIVFGLIGIIGVIDIYKKKFKYFTFFAILSISYLIFTLTYDIGDIIYYYIPLYFIYTICISFGLKRLYETLIESAVQRKIFFIVGVTICLVLMIALNYKSIDKSNQYFAYDYGKNIINSLDKNAILFTDGDFDLYPVWYYTLVVNNSKNPIIIDSFLLSKPWYVELLKQRKDLKITYNKSIPFYYSSAKEPEEVVVGLMQDIIEQNSKDKAIYTTIYFAHEKYINISQQYVLTPKNHVYQIEKQGASTTAVNLNLDYRGLFDSSIRKDQLTIDMISDLDIYLGIYYINKQDYNMSVKKLTEAIAINPKSFVAYADLAYLYFTSGDYKKSLTAYQKAYEIDPHNEEIFSNIESIKAILGQS